VYTLAAALFLLVSNGAQVIQAYLERTPPAYLEIYTTLELAALDLAISVPLFTAGALLLWRKKAWGYVITTLFAFVGCMTFLSLSVAQLLLFLSYQKGGLADIGVLVAFATISICFAAIIFIRMEEN
jgi:ABC-type spermidine/putrescine transport system permease subunit II